MDSIKLQSMGSGYIRESNLGRSRTSVADSGKMYQARQTDIDRRKYGQIGEA